MTNKYGPAERLDEQIEILLRDPGPTEIVVLSMLGEPALPRLCALLPHQAGKAALTVIRVLGMSGHPTVVPALAARLEATSKASRAWSRDETEPRAIVNALRKVGNDEALRAIVDNLSHLNLVHTKTILDAWGKRSREALLLKTAQLRDPAWLPAAKLVTTYRVAEAIPLLQHAAEAEEWETRKEALTLLAFYGPAAPKEWATRRLLDMQNRIVHAYLKVGRPRDEYGRRVRESGPDLEHDALLRVLYHAGDPTVLIPLLPYLSIEHSAGVTTMSGEPTPSVTLLALAFGERSLPVLSEENLAKETVEVREAAKQIRTKIMEFAKRAADYERARSLQVYRDHDDRLRAAAFKLEKTPLGDVELKGESDPLPVREPPADPYDDDE